VFGDYSDVPVTDSDLLAGVDASGQALDAGEAQAVQVARQKLRALGVPEVSQGIFTKRYAMTAAEQQRYDDALSVSNIFNETGNTVSMAASSIGDGLRSTAGVAGNVWDGLNKTLIIVSILVGVLTLSSFVRNRK
jgi:hypothetical protein